MTSFNAAAESSDNASHLHRTLEAGQIYGQPGESNTLEWLGVPYAEPPIGELRWRAPRPVKSWEGIKKTVSYQSSCPQMGHMELGWNPAIVGKPVGSENCLYLNVWRPNTQEELPIVLMIHGGKNFMGASKMMYGAHLADAANVEEAKSFLDSKGDAWAAEYLRNIPAEEIVHWQVTEDGAVRNLNGTQPEYTRLEDGVVMQKFQGLWQQGKFNAVPIMIGNTNHEFSNILLHVYGKLDNEEKVAVYASYDPEDARSIGFEGV